MNVIIKSYEQSSNLFKYSAMVRRGRMKSNLLALALCLALLCSCDDADTCKAVELPKIIFDTDIVGSTDDLVALCALYKYMDEGKCDVIGIVVDREGEKNAACVDVFNTYYGHPDIPIGLVRNGINNPVVWNDYSGIAQWKDSAGNCLFRHTIKDYSTLPDGWELYRTQLLSAPYKSVTIVSVGFVTALSQLLESEGGQQLVADKVRALYIMGGNFAVSSPDYNFAQGPEFAQNFIMRWPESTPIYFSPTEVGNDIYYSKQQLLDDLSDIEVNPLKEIYLRNGEDEALRMWDPLTLIHAVEGDEWFLLSEWGNVTIDSEGNTTFTASPNGNCRYQKPGDASWNSATLNKIRNLIKQ